MLGLVVLVFGVVYLALLVWATRAAYRWAKREKLSATKCRLAAAGGFLVVYLPVFWDLVPTLVAKQYLCATRAGFWELKSATQWSKENPGVLEILQPPGPSGSQSRNYRSSDGRERTTSYFLSEHITWVVSRKDISALLPIIRTEEQVRDEKRNEVLARYIDFSTGNSVKGTVGPPGPMKFWLSSHHCSGGGEDQDALRKVLADFSWKKEVSSPQK